MRKRSFFGQGGVERKEKGKERKGKGKGKERERKGKGKGKKREGGFFPQREYEKFGEREMGKGKKD